MDYTKLSDEELKDVEARAKLKMAILDDKQMKRKILINTSYKFLSKDGEKYD